MLYEEFLEELRNSADANYRDFHKRLLKNDNIKVLGVKVPVLRKLAKKYIEEIKALFTFPDEYYEVTFIKLTAVSLLDYNTFLQYVDKCVSFIDNWATCDCFTPKCIEKHKDEFLPYILRYLEYDGEFYQRFALTTLLHFYVEEKYYDIITKSIVTVDTKKYYYVHMAAAWLLAEIIIKFYDRTVEFLEKIRENELQESILNKETYNKSIQKACESYRLSDDRKIFLKGIKR